MSNREISNEEALKNFLLDIECLDKLSEWTSKFNMFDILKISRSEIRHSNMLAWLLDPNENHSLGDEVIRRFIQFYATNFSEDNDIFDILLKDCGDFCLLREYHNIDILAVSDKAKMVLCIENKIDSGEHDNQLEKYWKIVEEQYKDDYHKLYIFLSPQGVEPSNEKWCPMSYIDVLDIIERSMQRFTLIPESKLLIENYIDAVRRDIVGDEKLVKLCTDIYKKHKKAIDLIIENKQDKALEIAEIFRKWAQKKDDEGEIEFDSEKSVKKYTRFKTKEMSEYLPDASEPLSGWGTKNYYYYEILNNDGNDFFIQLVLNSDNIPDELREKCDAIWDNCPLKKNKTNWKWRVCERSKSKKIDDDYNEETIMKQLDEQLREIKDFEREMMEKVGEEVKQ